MDRIIQGKADMAKAKVRRLYSAERRLLESRGGLSAQDPMPGDGADRNEILKALGEIKDMIRKGGIAGNPEPPAPVDNKPEISNLHKQLTELRDHIEETKKEIASIRHPGDEEDRLTSAASELDAIVSATEHATHRILNATEELDERITKIRDRSDDVGVHAVLEEMSGQTIEILEACNFQDISGQRTNKVIKTINFLEKRILSMIDIWGAEEFEGIEVDREELEGDAALLQGPQHEGKGISQNDIDSLFD